jgi:hypothetical protein
MLLLFYEFDKLEDTTVIAEEPVFYIQPDITLTATRSLCHKLFTLFQSVWVDQQQYGLQFHLKL